MKTCSFSKPSVILKSVSLKSSGFHSRRPLQNARTAAGGPVSVQLRPSAAQRPRPVTPHFRPRLMTCCDKTRAEHESRTHDFRAREERGKRRAGARFNSNLTLRASLCSFLLHWGSTYW